jgi:hypothetical protein
MRSFPARPDRRADRLVEIEDRRWAYSWSPKLFVSFVSSGRLRNHRKGQIRDHQPVLCERLVRHRGPIRATAPSAGAYRSAETEVKLKNLGSVAKPTLAPRATIRSRLREPQEEQGPRPHPGSPFQAPRLSERSSKTELRPSRLFPAPPIGCLSMPSRPIDNFVSDASALFGRACCEGGLALNDPNKLAIADPAKILSGYPRHAQYEGL